MHRLLLLATLTLMACGGDDPNGGNGANGFGNGGNGSNGGTGGSCPGDTFELTYSGDRSASVSGGCVTSVFLDSALTGNVTAIEDNDAVGGGVTLILSFNQEDLSLQFAVFSDTRIGDDVGCAVGDITDGTVDDAVFFPRNDDSGYQLNFAFPVACCLDGALACEEDLAIELQVAGTLSEDNPL
jgi:hypothetical protein